MPPKQSKRKRGVFLSPAGWQRLQSAERQAEIRNNDGAPYTLEAISTLTQLSPNTITKVRRRQAAVDRQTLEAYFQAFRLQLRPDDYQPVDANREPASGAETSRPSSGSTPIYISRSQLEQRCSKIVQTPGSLLHIRGPRQIGKTTLMAKTATQSGMSAVILNLKLADSQLTQHLGDFLQWLCQAVAQTLGQPTLDHSDRQPDQITDSFGCTLYFQSLLSDLNEPLVLAFDEVDVLLKSPEIATNFFNLIRAWHELAQYGQDHSHIWRQLRIIMVHSSEIYLSDWEAELPLTFGTVVDVPNFTQAQVNELSQHYGLERPDAVAERLTHFLNGKPYLTQLALHHLQTYPSSVEQLTNSYLSPDSIFAEHLLYYLTLLQQHPDLLDSYQQVVQADQPILLPPLQAFKLSRLGLTIGQGQMALPLCHLYRVYFGHVLYS